MDEDTFRVTLSAAEQLAIFVEMKNKFRDFNFFDTMVSDKLLQLLADCNHTPIDVISTKRIGDKYFDTKSFKDTPKKKILFTQIMLIFKTSYVYILSLLPTFQSKKLTQIDLLEAFPDFKSLDDQELIYLVNFRNIMRIALKIIPAAAHKQLLINIAGRLEGSDCIEYITGGGQKDSVSRRVRIYENEGRIQPKPKCPKRSISDEQYKQQLEESRKYVGRGYVSVKKAQDVVLTEEEIEQLKRPRFSNSPTDSVFLHNNAEIPHSKKKFSDELFGLHQLNGIVKDNALYSLPMDRMGSFSMGNMGLGQYQPPSMFAGGQPDSSIMARAAATAVALSSKGSRDVYLPPINIKPELVTPSSMDVYGSRDGDFIPHSSMRWKEESRGRDPSFLSFNPIASHVNNNAFEMFPKGDMKNGIDFENENNAAQMLLVLKGSTNVGIV